MGIEILSPVGRFVQGSLSLEKKIDPQTNQPKIDPATGQPIMEQYMSLAIAKNDPGLPAFWGAIVAQAKVEFPHLFDAAGNCTHPGFAFKMQDGDGRDHNGKSVADKPGFAGHYVFKLATRFPPKCFHAGRYDASQQIQNPDEVIKRGYYVRVNIYVSGNGVKPNEPNKKPGMFLSPNIVELVGYGEVIQGGPDAAKVLGGAGAPAYLPPGMSATPIAAPGATVGALPPIPGAVAAPVGLPAMPAMPTLPAAVPALPALPQAAPAMPGLPSIPAPGVAAPVPHVPQLVLTAKAMGLTQKQMHAQQWTDEMMVQHGYAVWQ